MRVDGYLSALRQLRDPMLDCVLDEGLQQHRRNCARERRRVDVEPGAQPLFEAYGFQREIVSRELDLGGQRLFRVGITREIMPKDIREPRYHVLGLSRIFDDQTAQA